VDADSHQKTSSADSGVSRDVETSVVESECIITSLKLQVLDNIYEWWSSECNVFIIILEYLTGIIYSYIITQPLV